MSARGGQAIPSLDYSLAPYVAKSYVRNCVDYLKDLDLIPDTVDIKKNFIHYFDDEVTKDIEKPVEQNYSIMDHLDEINSKLNELIDVNQDQLVHMHKVAKRRTIEETEQAMEAMIHNLCTMNCLAPDQEFWVYDTAVHQWVIYNAKTFSHVFVPGRFYAFSLNNLTGDSEIKPITGAWATFNDKPMVKVTDKSGASFVTTFDHRYLTVTDDCSFDYVQAQNLKYTVHPRNFNLFSEVNYIAEDVSQHVRRNECTIRYKKDYVPYSLALAELTGYYVSTGRIALDNSTLTIACNEKVQPDYVLGLCEEAFGCKPKYIIYQRTNESGQNSTKDLVIYLDAKFNCMIRKLAGSDATSKHVPNFVLHGSGQMQDAFLHGYLMCDDLRKECEYVEFNTTSKPLIVDLRMMFASRGVLIHTRLTAAGDEDQQPLWTGTVKYEELSRIEKNDTTDETSDPFTKCFKVGVVNIEQAPDCSVVYDIEVADNANFLTTSGFIVHNSRAGSQTPFSSVNVGLSTTWEGRTVTHSLLKAVEAGLGLGETAIFPISIFKMKKGVTDKGSPNYDLFQYACKVSAKRLYPNFLSIDAPFNLIHYRKDRPEYHSSGMGCRTRVIENKVDPQHAITEGRGNLFWTTINFPLIALDAKREAGVTNPIPIFMNKLHEIVNSVIQYSLDRFKVVAKRKAKNYPFMMGQHEYVGSEKLLPNDDIESVIKEGTMAVGFIGLSETLVALIGKHHGESEEAQELGLTILNTMKKWVDEASEKYGFNFGVMASPAEGCTGRLLRITRKKYGVIKGITDKEYFTNSFHICPTYKISAWKKVQLEAPYHAICTSGAISYVELDTDTVRNPQAFEELVNFMASSGCGYFAINHPMTRDPVCGYVGPLRPDGSCPRCGRKEFEGVAVNKLLSLTSYSPDPEYDVRLHENEETTTNTL